VEERVIWGGRYALYDEIATGGMATVYLAARLGADSEIPSVVALKKLAAQFAKQPEFVAMFLDEAHLAARIRHPNVVPTYEFLRTDAGLGIVMGLVIGKSLMQLVRGAHSAQTPPPLPVTLAIMVDALEGLHAAHEACDDRGASLNLVHRDVSPHNIIVGVDGVARVIDFGIAKAAGRLQVTDVGVLKGKFAYMAPEQITGKGVDRRADVYSAGIVLWEALAGRKLFRAATNEALLTQRTESPDDVPLPSSMNPEVSPDLDALLVRALHPDRSHRFGSARAMAEALREGFPVAEREAVSDWVRARAGDKLALLDGRRRQIEAEHAPSTEAPPARLSVPGYFISSRPSAPPPAPTGARPSRPPPSGAPTSDPRPPSSVSSTLQSARRGMPADIILESGDTGDGPPPSLQLDQPLSVQPTSASGPSVPGVIAARRPSMPVRQPRRQADARPRSRVFMTLLLLLCLVGGLVVVEGPALLRARVVSTAAADGLALSFDRLEVSREGLALRGAKATLVECAAFRLSADELSARLDPTGHIRAIDAGGFELVVTGTAKDASAQLASWRARNQGSVKISARGGHVVWTATPASAVTVEALDAAMEVEGGAEPSFALDSKNVLVSAPRGHLGPWTVHMEDSGTETRARLELDPSQPDGPPSVTFIQRRNEGRTWTLDIPRGSSFRIGVPSQLFGITSELAIEAALRLHENPGGGLLVGEGQLSLYGWPIATGRKAMVPVDLTMSGKMTGDPARPLPITDGKIAVGNTTSPMFGYVVIREDGFRIEIDRAQGRSGTAAALVLDTQEWLGP